MRLTSDGFVGIGTNNPQATMHLVDTGDNTSMFIESSSNNNASHALDIHHTGTNGAAIRSVSD